MIISEFKRALMRSAIGLAGLLCAGTASAYDWLDGFSLKKSAGDSHALIVSPYARHFDQDESHRDIWLVGIERERSHGGLAGIAYFSNSFGQPSLYYYPWGMVYREFLGQPKLTAKLTAGLLYGYTGKYEDKVPFNINGFSPGIVPALAWELGDGFQVQANLLGFNGMMLQFSLPLQ
jgi:hypothetical protein